MTPWLEALVADRPNWTLARSEEWNARLSVLVEAIAVLTKDEPTLTREVETGPEHMGAMARRFLDAAELLEACAQAMRLAESRIVEASCRQKSRDGASRPAPGPSALLG